MKTYNHLVDVAFTVEGPWERYEDIPFDVLVEGLQRRVNYQHANTLKLAADKYLAWHNGAFSNDAKMLKCGKDDYDDLISIVGMIENNEDKKKIGKSMWRLDTAVRDIIPDEVYYAYTN